MEAMKINSPQNPDLESDEIDQDILAALRSLPSEQGTPSAESERIIHHAAAARMAEIRKRSRIKRIAAAVTAMAACILLSTLIFQDQVDPKPIATLDLAKDDAAIILAEVSALFPGQIRAIYRDESGLHLTLSDSTDVVPALALVIQIDEGKRAQEIITFSGQSVEIMGKSITVHAVEGGKILLDGQTIQMWNDKHSLQLSIRTLKI